MAGSAGDGGGRDEHDGGKGEQRAGEYFMFHAISPILPKTNFLKPSLLGPCFKWLILILFVLRKPGFINRLDKFLLSLQPIDVLGQRQNT